MEVASSIKLIEVLELNTEAGVKASAFLLETDGSSLCLAHYQYRIPHFK